MSLRSLARLAPRATPRAARGLSTAEPTPVVDQMIAYAREINAVRVRSWYGFFAATVEPCRERPDREFPERLEHKVARGGA